MKMSRVLQRYSEHKGRGLESVDSDTKTALSYLRSNKRKK